MTLNWADLAAIGALVAVCWAVTCAVLRRAVRRAVSEQQRATERHLKEMVATIQSLQTQVDELSEARGLTEPVATEFDMETAAATASQAARPEDEEVTPEVMAVLAAAASAFLGAKVRVLSAKLLESPHRVVNAWSQQGRVFVQASHNLRSRL